MVERRRENYAEGVRENGEVNGSSVLRITAGIMSMLVRGAVGVGVTRGAEKGGPGGRRKAARWAFDGRLAGLSSTTARICRPCLGRLHLGGEMGLHKWHSCWEVGHGGRHPR